MLGAALQSVFGDDVLLTDGPPLREEAGPGGFFYEMHIRGDVRLTEELYPEVRR